MQLEIFDKYSRLRIGIIKTYNYLTYEDIMDDSGNFEITIPAKTQTLSLLNVGNYIWFEKGIVGIIKGKKDTEDEDYEATIYGSLSNEILAYRCFLKTTQYYDKINLITTQMLNDLFISPVDSKRTIDFISIQNNMPTFDNKIRVQNTGDSLLSYLAEMYFPYDLGFELYPIFENKTVEGDVVANLSTFEFRLLKPVNRTYNNQDGNVPVVFSFDLSNLQKIEHEEDSRAYSNLALVASEGTGGNRKTLEVGDTTSEGIDRIELYVDARDIQSDADPENPLTDEQLEEIMLQRGNEKLQEHQTCISFEATIIEGKYKYGVDFYKGDFVSVIDKNTKVIHNVQVNSIRKTISNGVEHLDIIFGKDNLAISEMTSKRTTLVGSGSSGGGGGGSSTLSGLDDVNVTGVSSGDVLAYNGTSSKWEDKTLADVATSGSYNDLSNKPSIPTKTSDLNNDSNFVSDSSYVHTDNNYTSTEKNKLSGIAAGAEVNVQSNWNETNTGSDAYIQNKPTKLTDFSNDAGFITKAVSDLTNYYLKSETYNKSEVDQMIQAITTINIEVVQTLPTTGISTTTIYLVPKSTAGTQNVYDEYINLDGTTSGWELIGDTEIDLSNYYTKSQVDALIPTVNDATLTIKNGPTSKGTFTANASSNANITVLPFDITINVSGGYDVTYPS